MVNIIYFLDEILKVIKDDTLGCFVKLSLYIYTYGVWTYIKPEKWKTENGSRHWETRERERGCGREGEYFED